MNPFKPLACALALALVPMSIGAEPYLDTVPIMYVPRLDRVIPHLYVHARTSVDISLPDNENLVANPIIGDPRWKIATFVSGHTVHVTIKASDELPDLQLLTIPGSEHAVHLIVSSGKSQSTAYTVAFYELKPPSRSTYHIGQPFRPALTPMASSTPKPTAKSMAIADCNTAGMDTKYSWTGDKRIDVRQVCDDGKHTWVIMQPGRIPSGTVPYKVDLGGKQDQIANATFAESDGGGGQWIIDGVANSWALVVDSSTGHMRKNISHAQ